MKIKDHFSNNITQTDVVDIILPSGDVVQTEVTSYITWDTICAILVLAREWTGINPKDILNDIASNQ